MSGGTIEAQICVNGFRAELKQYVHQEPSEQILRSDGEYVLGITLTPQYTRPQVSFAQFDAARRFVSIRRPVLQPAGLPLITRVSRGRERSVELGIARSRFAELTGHGNDWSIAELEACTDIREPRVADALMRLAREIAEPGFAAAALTEAIGIAAIIDLARYLRRRPAAEAPDAGGLAPRHLALIREYVEESAESAPTIAALAALCGLSERHLMRVFRQATGETVKSYVERIRLVRAKSLLSGTSLPLKEIAGRLGFATPSSFSVAFRRATGETPLAFRQHFRPVARS